MHFLTCVYTIDTGGERSSPPVVSVGGPARRTRVAQRLHTRITCAGFSVLGSGDVLVPYPIINHFFTASRGQLGYPSVSRDRL